MAKRIGKKRRIIVTLAVGACAALVILFVLLILPGHRLARAGKLYEAGDYAAAYALLQGRDDPDSAALSEKCLFQIQKARLDAVTAGSVIRFGWYEQDNDASDGKEEIEWIVLDTDGSRALVVSKYGLEPREFNDELNLYKAVAWDNSQLRSWLNDAFYNSAFSAGHQKMILLTDVKADPNPDSRVHPGRNTKDHVFLLSVPEAAQYFASDSERQCFGTAYCHALGAEKGDGGACWWWLRTPGIETSTVSVVIARGAIFTNGFSCGHVPNLAVRPAMWIDLGADAV